MPLKARRRSKGGVDEVEGEGGSNQEQRMWHDVCVCGFHAHDKTIMEVTPDSINCVTVMTIIMIVMTIVHKQSACVELPSPDNSCSIAADDLDDNVGRYLMYSINGEWDFDDVCADCY